MKLTGKVVRDPKNNRLDFDSDADRDLDPGFLNPDLDPRICISHCGHF